MLWEAGGDILTADSTKAAFNSPQGVTRADSAAATWQQAKALYLDSAPDSRKANQLFNSGNKIGMFITGPWNLADFPDAKYGVQVMPCSRAAATTRSPGPTPGS